MIRDRLKKIGFLRRTFSFYQNVLCPSIKMLYYNFICKPIIVIFGKHDRRELKYTVSLCLIFKDEAPFLKEWIEFHKMIGIDHFYMYNNNSCDNFLEVLKPYMNKGLITLIDFPFHQAQMKAYKDCYTRFRGESKWISFLDADEFVCMKYKTDLRDWLKDYDKYPGVVINWLNFGTSCLKEHDFSKGVIEQYTKTSDRFFELGKCFVNTRFDIQNFDTNSLHHLTKVYYTVLGMKFVLPMVNQFYQFRLPLRYPYQKPYELEKSTIQINHYFMKAWNLYYERAHRMDVYFEKNPRKDLDYMFEKEEACIREDHTIQRFWVRFNLATGEFKL